MMSQCAAVMKLVLLLLILSIRAPRRSGRICSGQLQGGAVDVPTTGRAISIPPGRAPAGAVVARGDEGGVARRGGTGTAARRPSAPSVPSRRARRGCGQPLVRMDPTLTIALPLPSPGAPPVAENGTCFGQVSRETGRPMTIHIRGYYRRNGTYVRGHYRSPPVRKPGPGAVVRAVPFADAVGIRFRIGNQPRLSAAATPSRTEASSSPASLSRRPSAPSVPMRPTAKAAWPRVQRPLRGERLGPGHRERAEEGL
jgi:hypothetical protein